MIIVPGPQPKPKFHCRECRHCSKLDSPWCECLHPITQALKGIPLISRIPAETRLKVQTEMELTGYPNGRARLWGTSSFVQSRSKTPGWPWRFQPGDVNHCRGYEEREPLLVAPYGSKLA